MSIRITVATVSQSFIYSWGGKGTSIGDWDKCSRSVDQGFTLQLTLGNSRSYSSLLGWWDMPTPAAAASAAERRSCWGETEALCPLWPENTLPPAFGGVTLVYFQRRDGKTVPNLDCSSSLPSSLPQPSSCAASWPRSQRAARPCQRAAHLLRARSGSSSCSRASLWRRRSCWTSRTRTNSTSSSRYVGPALAACPAAPRVSCRADPASGKASYGIVRHKSELTPPCVYVRWHLNCGTVVVVPLLSVWMSWYCIFTSNVVLIILC